MSIPTAVFFDTSALEGQSYNFASTALSTFVPACKQRKLKLLLPDPTEREIKRHMAKRSEEAAGLIEQARRTAPFLSKWTGFPPPRIRTHDAATISRVTGSAWLSFLNQFEVVRLNYDGIRVATVMNWYDESMAPFDKSKKRKEFPDAFAIAILSAYAEKKDCSIAVVSLDQDLKRACDRFPSLMYFQSLPALTELLLSAEDGRIEVLRSVLNNCTDNIADAAYDRAICLTFYHNDSDFRIQTSEVQTLSIADMRIVALGEHECTIAFDAIAAVTHSLEWTDLGSDGLPEDLSADVSNDYVVTGTAKVSFDAKTNAMTGIPYLELNEDEIVVKDLSPFGRWR